LIGILETIAGIGVSVILFVLGYRSTIGARKERVKAARAEIVRVLLRLVAVDGNELTPIILNRTIAGIAAQQGVEAVAVGPPSLIANLLYAEVMKSDLMGGDAREVVRDRIEGAFHIDLGVISVGGEAPPELRPIRPAPAAPSGATGEAEEEVGNLPIPSDIATAEFTERESREAKRETGRTVALGILSTIIGTGATVVLWLSQSGLDRATFIATLAGSVTAMVALVGAIVTRQREQERVQEENIQDSNAAREYDSWLRMIRELNQSGARFRAAGPDSGADMRIELEDGAELLMELKRNVDRKTLGRVVERLNRYRHEQGSAEGVIVVLNPPPRDVMSNLKRNLPDHIHLMTRDEFILALHDDPAARWARIRRLK
jgi:hypothetical protein